MPTSPIQVGLIGYGFAGRTFHAPVIRAVPGLHLSAVVQRHGDDAQKALPGVEVLRSADDLLRQDSIRLVVIATSNTSHFELAKQCLLAGRDVVIDKPFATTLSQAEELARIAAQQKRMLSVFQNRRWDGDFLTVRQLLEAGTLGRIVLFETHFDRYRPQLRAGAWREAALPGSGVLLDLGPHLVDQALSLFGLPQAVGADIRIERDHAVIDDAFDLILYYPRMRACLRASMLAAHAGPRFLIHGSEASYLKHGLDPQEALLREGKVPTNSSWGEESPEAWGTIYRAENHAVPEERVPTLPGDYRRYYENVRDALLGKADVIVTPQQALHVMRVLDLAQRSSQERRVLPW